MNTGKIKIDLNGLTDFRKKLRECSQQVSEQENKTRNAINIVSQTWQDDNFKDFEAKFSQDMQRIKKLIEELNRIDGQVLKNYQDKLERYLTIKY